jgi:hypothetical protein
MTVTSHDPGTTMREARAHYFIANNFGDDGGYDDAWVNIKLGPLHLSLPNKGGRARAVPYHDLHHVITGYDTDIVGEFEIAGWEIGSGCKDYWVAWFLNTGSVTGGLLRCPRRTFRAFVRGRGSRTLYGEDLAALLTATVATVRSRMAVTQAEQRKAGPADVALFGLTVVAGVVTGSLTVALGALAAPFVLAWSALRRARPASPPPPPSPPDPPPS